MDDTSEATTVDRTRAPRPTRKWMPAPPKSVVGLALAAVAVAAAVLGAAFLTVGAVRVALGELEAETAWADVWLYALAASAVFLFVPAVKGLETALKARRLARVDFADARAATADASEKAKLAIGYAVAVLMVLAFGHFLIANEIAVGRTFFDVGLILETFHLVGKAFWVNVEIFLIAEVLVLVWGLLIAVARLAPGRAGAPIRLIATAYVDLFRGLPAIIAIYLVGFGLPLTDLPVLRDMTPTMFAILALTLTYGAYVSEVYRSGIESVHWSQTAAARSLGFSHGQTLRFVVVPQAVRRIIPPLLNDFISLQKDTALVSVIGTVDAFNQAKIIASNHFNLSSVTTVAVLFVLITIPQARLVDKLIERDQKRMRAGG
jgi:polar amino acid transport system permease protein